MREEIKKEYRICDKCGKKQEKNLEEQHFGICNPFEGWVTVVKEQYNNNFAKLQISTSTGTGPAKQFEFDFCDEVCLINFFNKGKE